MTGKRYYELTATEIAWLDKYQLADFYQRANDFRTQVEEARGICHWPKHRGKSWAEVQQTDDKYWAWAVEKAGETFELYRREVERRRQDREDHARAQLEAAAESEVFSDEERAEIVREDLLPLFRQIFEAGYKAEIFKSHPDRDGDASLARRLNRTRDLGRKLLAALEGEFNQ